MLRAARPGSAGASLLAIASVTGTAYAGNDEGFLLGNQAALMGGAVTATVAEGSAIWYNPAGLASIRSDSVDLSASAYGLRFYSVDRFLVAENGADTPVNVTELIIVPSALSYVRPIATDLRLGFGLFVPRANDLILRADLDAGSDGRWILAQAAYDRSTFGGASLGWSVRRNVRVGASLLMFHRFDRGSDNSLREVVQSHPLRPLRSRRLAYVTWQRYFGPRPYALRGLQVERALE